MKKFFDQKFFDQKFFDQKFFDQKFFVHLFVFCLTLAIPSAITAGTYSGDLNNIIMTDPENRLVGNAYVNEGDSFTVNPGALLRTDGWVLSINGTANVNSGTLNVNGSSCTVGSTGIVNLFRSTDVPVLIVEKVSAIGNLIVNGTINCNNGWIYVRTVDANRMTIGSTGTVNLKTDPGASYMYINKDCYVTVNGTLNIGGGPGSATACEVYVGDGAAKTAQLIVSGSGAVNVGGTCPGVLHLQDASQLDFSGGTISTGGTATNCTGVVNINSGCDILQTGGTFNHGNGSTTGTIGTLNILSSGVYNCNGGTFNNSTSSIGGGIDMPSGATFNIGGGTFVNAIGLATTFRVRSGANLNMTSGIFRNGGGTTGTLYTSLGGTVTVDGGTFVNGYSSLGAVNTFGALNLSGGTVQNGVGGTGIITWFSGSSGAFDGANIENGVGGSGTIDLNHPSVTLNHTAGYFRNGVSSPGVIDTTGNLNVNSTSFENGYSDAGTINIGGSGDLNVNTSNFSNGYGATGTINIASNATLAIQTAQTFANGVNGQGIINLNVGGTLTCPATILNIGAAQPGQLNLDGGTYNLTGAGEVNVTNGSLNITGIALTNPATGLITTGANGTIVVDNTFVNNGTITSDGVINQIDSPITNNEIVTNNGTLAINGNTFTNDDTLTNNGTILRNLAGALVNNGTFVNNGNYIDPDAQSQTTDPDILVTIPDGYTHSTPESTIQHYTGSVINLSGNTWDIYGKVYTYSYIQNGGATAGVINIHYPGSLYVLGGKIENVHADSLIDVKTGGALYNYYGEIDITAGGADSLEIQTGGKYHNVRGNYPGTFTVNNGCRFLDLSEVNLDSSLELDYTWTITDKAVINGYGNKITLADGGEIVLYGDSASLLLDDIIIEGVGGNNIRCTDNNTTLSLHNVVWYQDSNYSLTMGKFYVAGDWAIAGNDTAFSYQTVQTSEIAQDASIRFISNTFEYDTGAVDRLTLAGASSVLHLDRATMLSTQALTLSTGTLVTTGNATLDGSSARLDLQALAEIKTNGAVTEIGTVVV